MRDIMFGLFGIIAGLFIRFVIIEPWKRNRIKNLKNKK